MGMHYLDGPLKWLRSELISPAVPETFVTDDTVDHAIRTEAMHLLALIDQRLSEGVPATAILEEAYDELKRFYTLAHRQAYALSDASSPTGQASRRARFDAIERWAGELHNSARELATGATPPEVLVAKGGQVLTAIYPWWPYLFDEARWDLAGSVIRVVFRYHEAQQATEVLARIKDLLKPRKDYFGFTSFWMDEHGFMDTGLKPYWVSLAARLKEALGPPPADLHIPIPTKHHDYSNRPVSWVEQYWQYDYDAAVELRANCVILVPWHQGQADKADVLPGDTLTLTDPGGKQRVWLVTKASYDIRQTLRAEIALLPTPPQHRPAG